MSQKYSSTRKSYKQAVRGKSGGDDIYTDGGKYSGRVQGDTFVRKIRNSHVLRQPPALAMDCSIAEKLKIRGVMYVEFRNLDTGETYRTTLQHLLDKSLVIDRGFGKQFALPLAGWSRRVRGDAVQLDMFRGGA